MRTMGAAKAKTQFLSLLDEVEMRREPVLVTKNGKPVAKLIPLQLQKDVDPLDAFRYPGTAIVGNITAPIYTDAEWDDFFEASSEQKS